MRNSTKSGTLPIFVSFINEQKLMDYQSSTCLNGNITMTSRFYESKRLQRDKVLYKFLWVQNGLLVVEMDHISIGLVKDEIITPAPLRHLEVEEVEGKCLILALNSNFYRIFEHDDEVSYNDILFYGPPQVMRLELSEEWSSGLYDIVRGFCRESAINDSFQGEILRITLKRFTITCIRIARTKLSVRREHEKAFDIIRQFYVLVDGNFREKKQIQGYTGILCRSPKTLSNLFSAYGLPSPLRIIHERIETGVKRLLLYTQKSTREIEDILDFEGLATFSRFFKKMAEECMSEYQKRV